jgi:hypothetical protein
MSSLAANNAELMEAIYREENLDVHECDYE